MDITHGRLYASVRVGSNEDVRALRKREWVVLGTLLAMAIFAFFNVKRVVIHGVSMQPTFRSNQSVFVWTSAPRNALKPGDIIVFRSPEGEELIKRIVFIQNKQGTLPPPEDVWTPDGGQPFVELFDNFFPTYKSIAVVPSFGNRRIWVMSDNYEHSEDSRDFGPIAPKDILGKVIL
jgi:signal peptidase I